MSNETPQASYGKIILGFVGGLIGFVLVTTVTGKLLNASRPEPIGTSRGEARIQARRELEAQAQKVLTNYAWVNQDAGIVQMPIDEAMDRVVKEWTNPEAARAKMIERVKQLQATKAKAAEEQKQQSQPSPSRFE